MELTKTSNPELVSFRLNNFQISLSLTDTELLITTEQDDAFRRFHLTITPENVKDLTSYIFRDIEMMYLDLSDCFEHKISDVKITLSDDARLHYSREREAWGEKGE